MSIGQHLEFQNQSFGLGWFLKGGGWGGDSRSRGPRAEVQANLFQKEKNSMLQLFLSIPQLPWLNWWDREHFSNPRNLKSSAPYRGGAGSIVNHPSVQDTQPWAQAARRPISVEYQGKLPNC